VQTASLESYAVIDIVQAMKPDEVFKAIELSINPWIDERLRTWSFPDDSERARIAEAVTMTEKALEIISASLHTTIPQDVLVLDNLELYRIVLERQLRGCKSLLAPIRLLPPDLLIEVFRLCEISTTLKLECRRAWWGPPESMSVVFESPGTALLPVCSLWSVLVSSTPSLWTRLSIEIDNHSATSLLSGSLISLQRLLAYVIERSGEVPLDVRIVLRQYWLLASTILKPVLAQVQRWKYFDMILPPSYLGDVGLSSLQGSLTNLETLTLEVDDSTTRHILNYAGEQSNWFSDAPRLRMFKQVAAPLGLFEVPWRQLQSLSLYSFYDDPDENHVEVLASATSLRSLRLGYPFSSMDSLEPRPLPNITFLQTSYHGDLEFLQGCFTFPNLTELVLGGDDIFVLFLSEVSPTLRRLVFDDSGQQNSSFSITFFEIDACFPELTELEIDRKECIGRIALATRLTTIRDRFPKLSHLTCRFEHVSRMEDLHKVFCAFIDSTPQGRIAIAIQLSIMSLISEIDLEILQDMSSRGVLVTVSMTDSEPPDLVLEE